VEAAKAVGGFRPTVRRSRRTNSKPVRGPRPEVYASDRYDASQKLGEQVRASGGAGLLYDSLRRRTGSNVVAHRPGNITDIVQTDHFEITVEAASRMIDVRRLSK
jgi:hypothetical protein